MTTVRLTRKAASRIERRHEVSETSGSTAACGDALCTRVQEMIDRIQEVTESPVR